MQPIEFFYFGNCPHYLLALNLLDEILDRENLHWPVEMVLVTTPEAAIEQKFLGSPSIRIGGEDLEFSPSEEKDYALKCRVYQTGGKAQGFPSEQLIRDALQRARKKIPPNPLNT